MESCFQNLLFCEPFCSEEAVPGHLHEVHLSFPLSWGPPIHCSTGRSGLDSTARLAVGSHACGGTAMEQGQTEITAKEARG